MSYFLFHQQFTDRIRRSSYYSDNHDSGFSAPDDGGFKISVIFLLIVLAIVCGFSYWLTTLG